MRTAATILAGACTLACSGPSAPAPSATSATTATTATSGWRTLDEVISLPRYQHGFDARDDNDESRRVIRTTVSFIERQLRAAK